MNDEIRVLEVLPGDRAIVSTLGLYRVENAATGKLYSELQTRDHAAIAVGFHHDLGANSIRAVAYGAGTPELTAEQADKIAAENKESFPPSRSPHPNDDVAKSLSQATGGELVVEYDPDGFYEDDRSDQGHYFDISHENECGAVQLGLGRFVDDRDCDGNLAAAILDALRHQIDEHMAFRDRCETAFRETGLLRRPEPEPRRSVSACTYSKGALIQ